MSKLFFVAELSANHNQSLETALQLVRAAADAGADAVKLQTYTPDCLTMDSDKPEFLITDPKSLWYGKTLYQLYTEAAMPWSFHAPIFEECKRLGIIGFSTPFSEKAVKFLEELNVPMYKIASFEINHIPMIELINKAKKPVLASTGVAYDSDIRTLIEHMPDCPDLVLLKCTSNYPANPQDANLNVMKTYGTRYHCRYGLSDHTLTNHTAMVATALGASVIEKHLKLNNSDVGVDSGFSITPEEFKHLIQDCKKIREILGDSAYTGNLCHEWGAKPTPEGMKYKRSIYVVKDIKKGEKFTEENIKIIRPYFGCQPLYYPCFLGKFAQEDYVAGTPTNYWMVAFR